MSSEVLHRVALVRADTVLQPYTVSLNGEANQQ
jgi:hypothetical protein